MKPEIKIKGLKINIELEELEVPHQENEPHINLDKEKREWYVEVINKLEGLKGKTGTLEANLNDYILKIEQKLKMK